MRPRNTTPNVFVRFICTGCMAGFQAMPDRCKCNGKVRELAVAIPAAEFLAKSVDARMDLRVAAQQRMHPAVLVSGGGV